jgi:RpiR family transcriptional regulator, carbohydrate utilization regulator
MQTESVVDELRHIAAGLNRAEKAVAEAILSDVAAAVDCTIRQLAERAGVSEPTVVRLARRLGCSGFPQLKRRLSQDLAVAHMFSRPDLIGKPRDAVSVGSQIYEAASQALTHAFSSHDPNTAERAATLLNEADQVFCLGTGGNSANMAHEAENRLFRFGIKVQTLIDPYRQRMVAAVAEPGQIFLILSMTGRPQTLLDVAQTVRMRGARVICITRRESPLAAMADELLVLDVPHQEADFQLPNRSRYAQLFTVDVLATLVGVKRQADALPRLKRMRTALVSLHGLTEDQPIGD